MNLTTSHLASALVDDGGRVFVSGLVALSAWMGAQAWQKYLERTSTSRSVYSRRKSLVWSKNVFWIAGVLGVGAVWASKIAGLALSLTALAGALLIVNKELLQCFIGYGVIAVNQPFRIGDFVELGSNSGRVIDVTLFGTVLAETGVLNQLTGKTVLVPNSALLSVAVRNCSATGKYIVNLYPITVGPAIDLARAENCALDAANEVTQPWQAAAERHLAELEESVHLDLPSARPKVLWNGQESRLQLVIRMACPLEERVAAEQAVFKRFWSLYEAEGDTRGRPAGKAS